jgi:hypothetical protein
MTAVEQAFHLKDHGVRDAAGMRVVRFRDEVVELIDLADKGAAYQRDEVVPILKPQARCAERRLRVRQRRACLRVHRDAAERARGDRQHRLRPRCNRAINTDRPSRREMTGIVFAPRIKSVELLLERLGVGV